MARYAGEELAILLPSTGAAASLLMARSLREAVANAQLELRGSTFGRATTGFNRRLPSAFLSSLWTSASSLLAEGKPKFDPYTRFLWVRAIVVPSFVE